jgi:uncharacterized protein YciW
MNTFHDVIDQIVPLNPSQTTYAVRHERAKVVASTQGSYEVMFSNAVEGISETERLLVALHACRLSNASSLATHYREQLLTIGVDRSLIDVTDSNASQANLDARLQIILHFTSILILRPLEGDKQAIDVLAGAGLTTPAIVALGQLIAFLSYQIRMTAGLQAMAALEQAA